MTEYNIFSENIYPDWNEDNGFDEFEVIQNTRKIVEFFIKSLSGVSCLENYDYNTLSFDILFCDSEKTHEINREYRQKDYPADIITFAIFADSEEKFILDEEICEFFKRWTGGPPPTSCEWSKRVCE